MAAEQRDLHGQINATLAAKDRIGLAEFLSELRSSEIAEVIELLDNDDRRMVFDMLDKEVSAEVLEKVDEATRAELFELFEDTELTRLISELDPDDAADVLAEMPTEESQEVLERIEPAQADRIKGLMSYSEDSAGGIMDPMVLSVNQDATVRQTIDKIRHAEIDEDFFTVFVVDDNNRFVGDVRIRLLITRPENAHISELIEPDTIYVTVDTDQEQVKNIFEKNDLIVVPVLDEEHRLVGRITADRVIEVASEEAAEDLYVMAGTDAAELEKISVFHAARVRMTWLLPCLAGTAMTAVAGMLFRNIFLHADHLHIFLTAIIFSPMIAAISGNAGLQTSAIVVCGLATGDLAALKISQVFMREVRIALLVAVCCGITGAFICCFLPRVISVKPLTGITAGMAPAGFSQGAGETERAGTTVCRSTDQLRIALAFGTAMFWAIVVSTTLGLLLPFLFRRIGLDPAISSGPLVTTVNDSISVTIYMSMTLLLTT